MNDVIREAAEMIVDLSEKLDRAEADWLLLYRAVKRVRDLHKPDLDEAEAWLPQYREANLRCNECIGRWPCDTIRALDGVQA